MPFRHITTKLGNMRKATQWTLYPKQTETPHKVIIQCDKRIAEIDLNTGKAMLSSGKGTHNGFIHLLKVMGATEIKVSQDIIAELQRLITSPAEPNGILRI